MIELLGRHTTLNRIAWGLLALVVATSALAREQTHARLRRIVGIAAEHGSVALDGDILSVFSPANIRVQDARSLEWDLAKNNGAVSMRVGGARWQELTKHLSRSAAHDFAFCDPLNQVDIRLRDEKVSSALPAGAKVKSIFEVSSDTYVAVYSVSGSAVAYDVRVGVVVVRAPEGWVLASEEVATEYGNFCGVQRGKGGVFFVFADEPAGSSDFSAVYAYAVVDKDHSRR